MTPTVHDHRTPAVNVSFAHVTSASPIHRSRLRARFYDGVLRAVRTTVKINFAVYRTVTVLVGVRTFGPAISTGPLSGFVESPRALHLCPKLPPPLPVIGRPPLSLLFTYDVLPRAYCNTLIATRYRFCYGVPSDGQVN